MDPFFGLEFETDGKKITAARISTSYGYVYARRPSALRDRSVKNVRLSHRVWRCAEAFAKSRFVAGEDGPWGLAQ